MIKIILFVFLGGGLGAVTRFLIGKGFFELFKNYWSGITFANLLGSVLIFFLMKGIGSVSEEQRALWVIGCLGGLTTFSSFSYEAFNLLAQKRMVQFWSIMGLNVVLGITVGFLFIGKKLPLN